MGRALKVRGRARALKVGPGLEPFSKKNTGPDPSLQITTPTCKQGDSNTEYFAPDKIGKVQTFNMVVPIAPKGPKAQCIILLLVMQKKGHIFGMPSTSQILIVDKSSPVDE